MGKHLTAQDLAKMKDIIDQLKAVVQVQDELKSLSEGVDEMFAKTALEQIEKQKNALHEKWHELIESLK